MEKKAKSELCVFNLKGLGPANCHKPKLVKFVVCIE